MERVELFKPTKNNRISLMTKYIPTWAALHRLYGGLIGKALFLISLATPLAALKAFGISFENEHIFLIGATIVAIGFIIEQLLISTIPKTFTSREQYAEMLLQREKMAALDLRFETNELCSTTQEHIKSLLNESKLPNEIINYFPFDHKKSGVLGESKAAYYGGLLIYEYHNRNLPLVRLIISLLLALGLGLIYYKAVRSLTSIILG